jgi:putative SOS response-associated peptidase YedK
MCGRYVTGTDEHDWHSWATLLELTTTPTLPELPSAFVPTASVPIIRHVEAGNELAWARWGLVPSWLDRPLQRPPQFNVRAETAPQKFKKYLATRRCLLVASGFWVRRAASDERAFKTDPHAPREARSAGDPAGRPSLDLRFITVPGEPLFGLAGLWTERELDGEPLRSCTILTTEADAEIGELHDRMPIVLVGQPARRWLDPGCASDELEALYAAQPRLAVA